MKNPFDFGGAVGTAFFCNRTREIDELQRMAENGQRVLVYGERRVGKTSLVRQVIDRLDPKAYLPIYVDLWPTSSASGFVSQMAEAITRASASSLDKMAQTARKLFASLTPSFTIDDSGDVRMEFGYRPGQEEIPGLREVLEAPARLAGQAGKKKRRVVVIFDEFQQIATYGDDQVEPLLRSIIQFHDEVGYFFLGSRKHMIQELFMDRKRPLYQSAAHYPLGTIAVEHWKPFIQERFEEAGKEITDAEIERLCALTEGHPYYMQYLAYLLWDLAPQGAPLNEDALDQALETTLRRHSYEFDAQWQALTPTQRRLLWALSQVRRQDQLMAAAFVQQYQLGAPSTIKYTTKALLKRDVIDRDEEGYYIPDRFFRLWISRRRQP